MQRKHGVANPALRITSAGQVGLNTLRGALASQTGASQPGGSRPTHLANVAKFCWKRGKLLEKTLISVRGDNGRNCLADALGSDDRNLLEDSGVARNFWLESFDQPHLRN